MVEHYLDTVGVRGSNPLSRTILITRNFANGFSGVFNLSVKIILRLAVLTGALLLIQFLAAESAAIELVPERFGDGRQPQVAVAPTGAVSIVFAHDNSVYLVQSTDEGLSFSAPAKIADVRHLMVGMRRGPRIAATAKRILVTVPGKELFSFMSEDAGKTWSACGQVNDKSGVASEGLQNIAALPDGSFYAVWLDSRNTGAQIEGSRLGPESRIWGRNVEVYTSPDKTVCECCHPSIASDGKNKLVVMWRNWLEGNRDLYKTESLDRGDHFSSAVKIGTGSWPIKACPMDGGGIIAVAKSGTFSVWRRRNEIFLSSPSQPEAQLGSGTQPVLARVNGRILSVWQDGGTLVVKDRDRGEVRRIPGEYPALTASSDGQRAYLVWEGSERSHTVPKFAVLQ